MDIKLDQFFRDKNELFQRILNSIAEGIIIANAKGEFLFFNNVAEEILGIGKREIKPEEWSEVYGCFYIDQITPFPSEQIPLAQTLRTGEVSRETVFIKNPVKTEGVFIDITSSPIIGDNDIVLGAIVAFKDITESKKSEMHLKKLSNAVNQTADAVMITNIKGIIEYVNPAFETMTGYKREEVIGQTPRILKSGEFNQSFYKNLWRTILNGNPYKGEMINKKKNGEYYWLQNTITPMKDSNGNITNFVSVKKDITEIKAKKEQEIRLQIAKEIQQRLYTSNIYMPGYDIAGKNFPANETGGDYFDIILTSDGSLWLTIADVSNHGIGPALIMAGTRAYFRAFVKTSSDPAQILEMLNNELYSDLDDFQYVTMLLVRLNSIKNEIEYAGAGHVPAYLLNSFGEIEHILKSTGIPLGYRENELYENSKITDIASGNILVLLTDGIIEAQDKHENELGYERTLNLIKCHRNETSEDIIGHVYREVCAFTQKSQPEDDITALICKLNDIHNH